MPDRLSFGVYLHHGKVALGTAVGACTANGNDAVVDCRRHPVKQIFIRLSKGFRPAHLAVLVHLHNQKVGIAAVLHLPVSYQHHLPVTGTCQCRCRIGFLSPYRMGMEQFTVCIKPCNVDIFVPCTVGLRRPHKQYAAVIGTCNAAGIFVSVTAKGRLPEFLSVQ